jgi:hypothetical protein
VKNSSQEIIINFGDKKKKCAQIWIE